MKKAVKAVAALALLAGVLGGAGGAVVAAHGNGAPASSSEARGGYWK